MTFMPFLFLLFGLLPECAIMYIFYALVLGARGMPFLAALCTMHAIPVLVDCNQWNQKHAAYLTARHPKVFRFIIIIIIIVRECAGAAELKVLAVPNVVLLYINFS
uniref:Putative secreted peptide n=1 Tax=Anopheles braziliensis TaxID=58242 RepID=A0A2M3ZUR8_9DIPT